MDGRQQVGVAYLGREHASLWSGTAASWVDLNPNGATTSEAWDVRGGQQVGRALVTGLGWHASVWSGSASSWLDLHAFLPAGFVESQARAIWSYGGFVYVGGSGVNSLTGRTEALLWKRPGPPPCGADFDDDSVVDFFDYDAFVVCFEGGQCPPGKTADFDGDGSADFFDYDAFVVAFEAGC